MSTNLITHTDITDDNVRKANPWFFWEPMERTIGYQIPKLKQKNGIWYYFVRYENHTTVYDINSKTLELSYRTHISDDKSIDLDD